MQTGGCREGVGFVITTKDDVINVVIDYIIEFVGRWRQEVFRKASVHITGMKLRDIHKNVDVAYAKCYPCIGRIVI